MKLAKRLIAILLLLLLLVISICVVILVTRPGVSVGNLQIQNQSGQQLNEIAITIGKNTFRFVNLPANSGVEFSYPITQESEYVVRARLVSGQSFDTETGYVTRGFDFSDRLIVSENGLAFERLQVSTPKKTK